jgi:hypothetical protein
VSSGPRKTCRLSRRGNRRLNHAIHMAAVSQVSHRHRAGRAYFDNKQAEGKTPKQALRSLKRNISDAIFARPQADARRTATPTAMSPAGQPGNHFVSRAAGSHPRSTGSSDKPLPDLPPPYDRGQQLSGRRPPCTRRKQQPEPLDAKRRSIGAHFLGCEITREADLERMFGMLCSEQASAAASRGLWGQRLFRMPGCG